MNCDSSSIPSNSLLSKKLLTAGRLDLTTPADNSYRKNLAKVIYHYLNQPLYDRSSEDALRDIVLAATVFL